MDSSLILVGVVSILFVYLFHKYFIRINDYWKNKGIPTIPGAWPFFGHTIKIFWSYGTFFSFCEKMYKSHKGRSMLGYFQFRRANLLVFDPELIKAVLMSDFAKFQVNVFEIDSKVDPLLAENPFFNTGERWKELRSHLAYALMSSKRLRIFSDSVNRISDKLTKYLREKVEKSGEGKYEVEMKQLSNCFTGEVVASAGFGAEGDFFTNGSGPNSFREAVDGFMEPTFFNMVQQTLLFYIPALNSLFGISFLPKKMDTFFRRVVHEMIAIRQKDGISRNDFLQVMLDRHEKQDDGIDENSITANATSFFMDGYETSAVTLSFFVYHVADNPTIQEKMRQEIVSVLDKYDGQINYESLGEMSLVDRALNESMRMCPATMVIVKKCNETCKFLGKDGLECLVEPGTEIIIPVQLLHNDPEYWPDPDTFDPERFSEENKKNRTKMTFLPFSEGPRSCPGMRFAMMQIKGAIATILKNYKIEVSPKTQRPLVFKTGTIFPVVEGGLWVNIKPL